MAARESLGSWAVWAVVALGAGGCSSDAETTSAAADAGSDSGAPSGQDASAAAQDPDYAKVFSTDQVHEIAIELTATAAAAQEADLVALLGAFGSGTTGPGPGGGGGGPSGGQVPAEATAACAGKKLGDACTVLAMAGSCTTAPGGSLACLPSGGIPGGGAGGGPGGGGALDLVSADPIYVSATVRQGSQVWEHVGMRYKGNSSLRSSWGQGIRKLPFRLNFDKFKTEFPTTKGQRFFGFEELTFASNWSDASFARELLAGEVFRNRGVPAARAAFYRVTLDKGDGKGPVYMGLYTAVEDPSDAMMTSVYGDDSGNLYKPDGTAANWSKFDAADFEKKTNSKAADFSDVAAAVAALNSDRSDAAKWRAGLEKVFAVDDFLLMIAVNNTIVNWDSYGQMAHNYYLYGVPSDGGRLQWIPWDFNLSMQSGGGDKAVGQGTGLSLSMSEVTSNWPLIRYLMDDPTYRATYRKHLTTALQGAFEAATFAKRVNELHALIAPHVVGAKGEVAPYSTLSAAADFEASAQVLINHAKARATAVAEELAKP